MSDEKFLERYKKLNPEQKEAVDTVDGPVLVVAGPGTGKTEILTLRIANILQKTDTPASGILALTFTNSGVKAMRERLIKIVGSSASRVVISTFHSFAISLISEFYEDLSLEKPPKLLPETDQVILFDELLESHDWQYIRPRGGGEHNFRDLKSLVSLLKQERLSPQDFLKQIEDEIERIKNDPESISSRGPTKGKMKTVEAEKIEKFERTKEISKFYELYEQIKKERSLADYNDVLEYIVTLVKRSEDARATIRERYLYVLVDEHQDSSGVQNEFIEEVWAGVEKPNIFVVGDDRQLIFEFGGASLSHFERFPQVFSDTKVISLTVNRRSTQTILDIAHTLLQSSLVKDELKSVSDESYPVMLVEAQYPRDEIIYAGLEIKKHIENGIPAKECVVLVPKQAQVRSAIAVLKDLGLSVASGGKTQFFALNQTQSLISFLRALQNPYDGSCVAKLLLDPSFGVPFVSAQKFLREHRKKLSIESLSKGGGEISILADTLMVLLDEVNKKGVYELVQRVAEEIFFKKTTSHKNLIIQIEVVRTMLHLVLECLEKNHKLGLADFLVFVDRLESYNQDIPLAVFSSDEGVKVMTLHSSKGLEFDFVWIAHLDESSLMKGKQMAITLPESIKEKVSKKDEITAKRELYVGITRAKRFCALSYARSGYSGASQQVAKILLDLPEDLFIKKTAEETEDSIRKENVMVYVDSKSIEVTEDIKKEIVDLVKLHYADVTLPVTHLNNFFSCPWKWYFRNFLMLPEMEAESLQFGNLAHTAIERLIKDKVDSKDRIPQLINDILDDLLVFEERTRTRFVKDATYVLERFIQKHLPQFALADSEKKASVYRDPSIPNIEVGGKIDIVQTLPDGTLVVTDFKTGSVKNKKDIEKMTKDGRMSDMMRQLTMYSYLLEHGTDSVKVSLSQLLFLEAKDGDEDELYKTTIGYTEIELLRKDIKDYNSLLSNGEWIDLPCNFKPFGNQKECEYCTLAKQLV